MSTLKNMKSQQIRISSIRRYVRRVDAYIEYIDPSHWGRNNTTACREELDKLFQDVYCGEYLPRNGNRRLDELLRHIVLMLNSDELLADLEQSDEYNSLVESDVVRGTLGLDRDLIFSAKEHIESLLAVTQVEENKNPTTRVVEV